MSQTGAPSCTLPPLMRTGAKVVAKARADEKVGVFVRRGGRLQVVEYSEMRPEDCSAAEAGVHLSMPVLPGCGRSQTCFARLLLGMSGLIHAVISTRPCPWCLVGCFCSAGLRAELLFGQARAECRHRRAEVPVEQPVHAPLQPGLPGAHGGPHAAQCACPPGSQDHPSPAWACQGVLPTVRC